MALVGGALVALALPVGSAQAADAKPAASEAAPAAAEAWAPKPGSPEAGLLERAEAYWKAKQTGEDISGFFPTNTRGRRWVEKGGIPTSEYRIERVYVDGDRGYVVIRSKMRPTGRLAARIKDLPEDIQQSLLYSNRTEHWQKIDGTWLRKRVRSGLSRFMGARAKDETPEAAEPAAEATQQEQKTDPKEGQS